MALAWAAHHWKYCFSKQRSLVTFAYNCAHIVPRNLVNRVVGAHFSFIFLKQRNHEVKLPLARPHCPAMAGRRRAAEPAGVVPNTAPRWQAQKWSDPSRYVTSNLLLYFMLFCDTHDLVWEIISVSEKRMKNCIVKIINNVFEKMTKVGYFL